MADVHSILHYLPNKSVATKDLAKIRILSVHLILLNSIPLNVVPAVLFYKTINDFFQRTYGLLSRMWCWLIKKGTDNCAKIYYVGTILGYGPVYPINFYK